MGVTARTRLLDAADQLFYDEGVHTVGIDRVIERAGVAKATLYNAFGSKDGLVRAYLERRQQGREERAERWIAKYDDPKQRLLAPFEAMAELYSQPGYRGCAFLNASAEAPDGSEVAQICEASTNWIREKFRQLCEEAAISDPDARAKQLFLLYEGAAVVARFDRSAEPAFVAREAASKLIAG